MCGERDRADAEAVGQVEQHLVELGELRLVLGELPGLLLSDVAVEGSHEHPRAVGRTGDVEGVEGRVHVRVQRRDLVGDRGRAPRRFGQAAVTEAGDHRGCTGEQIAEVVPELTLIAVRDPLTDALPS